VAVGMAVLGSVYHVVVLLVGKIASLYKKCVSDHLNFVGTLCSTAMVRFTLDFGSDNSRVGESFGRRIL
jgi:hypothetical protein